MRKKIALVTGASRGIGRAIALELAASFDVVVNYARRDADAAVVATIEAAGGGRCSNGRIRGAHYVASKAALLALTAKASRELARDGIAVNAVLPSVIETDMLPALAGDDAARARLRAQFPVGRFGQPEEVAAVARFLCESAPAYLTGECIPLRGGRL